MTVLAATSSGGVVKFVQSVPLVVFYLATVAAAGFAIFKLRAGSITWHKALAVFTFVLGTFITVAIPKVSVWLIKFTAVNERLYVVVPLVILALTALIMTILENKK